MKCEDVMSTLVFKCDAASTVAECAQVMRDEQLLKELTRSSLLSLVGP